MNERRSRERSSFVPRVSRRRTFRKSNKLQTCRILLEGRLTHLAFAAQRLLTPPTVLVLNIYRTVARKGHYLYKLYFPRTNFIFLLQTLFSSHKLYFPRTNFIFLLQTLFSSYKLYFPRTNFILLAQTL